MLEYHNADGSLLCAFCDDDGRVDGNVCGHCLGTRAVICVRCGERAVRYDEGADPICACCDSTDNRNGEAA